MRKSTKLSGINDREIQNYLYDEGNTFGDSDNEDYVVSNAQ